jgi:putative colanic acid biosynthesis UDP-glucose lipid carrier transferase
VQEINSAGNADLVFGQAPADLRIAQPLATSALAPDPLGASLPAVSPAFISEVHALLLPLGMVLGAVGAKIIYLDLFLHQPLPVTEYLGAGLLAGIVASTVGRELDLNSSARIIAGEIRARDIFITVGLSFASLLVLFYLLKVSDHYSRGWLLLWLLLSTGILLVERAGVLLWARLLRAEHRLLQRVALYGDVQLALRASNRISSSDPNLVLAGIFSDHGSPGNAARGVPVAGDTAALIRTTQSGACDRIILTLPSEAHSRISEAIDTLRMLPVEVQLNPDGLMFPSQLSIGTSQNGLILLNVQFRPLSARATVFKSITDYALGLFGIFAFAPLMLVIAAAIKLDSRGPVLFAQSRHGYNHRVIRVLKFRTMTVAEDGPVVPQAVRGDKRVTRIGRILRRTSLDELPQLINVLRGELSLVGPRPHAVSHNDEFAKLLSCYPHRLKVKPGITGWAQVNGFRGETTTVDAMRQRLDLDLHYIKNWSFWFDVKILARTLIVPFSSPNAY